MRDPKRDIVEEQLNGGQFSKLSEADWNLISPYLEENEKQFGISVEDDLLTVEGKKMAYDEVYIKVEVPARPPLSSKN